MYIMVSNAAGLTVGWMLGQFPDRIAHLYSPGKNTPAYHYSIIRYALDNGRFGHETDWDEKAYMDLVRWSTSSKEPCNWPVWVAVPDVVGNAEETTRHWYRWSPRLKAMNLTLAFVVQDGHAPKDVPSDAGVVFVGGTTEWKWATLHVWCNNFPRVHVGRVNTVKNVIRCESLGVESVDGTGWFRAGTDPLRNDNLYELVHHLRDDWRNTLRDKFE